MDKALFQPACARDSECRCCPGSRLARCEWTADPQAVQRRIAEFSASLPDHRVIVKPSRLGSSVGIAIVHHPDDPEYAGGAIVEALGYDDTVIVEAYLDHPRELEMSVVGNSAADLESVRTRRDLPRPRVLRLLGQIRGWRLDDNRLARYFAGAARAPAQGGPRGVPGDRWSGLRPRRLHARSRERRAISERDQHHSRVSRPSACFPRCVARAAMTSARSASASSGSRWSARQLAHGAC